MYTLPLRRAPIYFAGAGPRTAAPIVPGRQAGKGGIGRLGVANTTSVIALMLRFP